MTASSRRRRRGSRQLSEPDSISDGIVDILANLVGVLVLVGLLTAVNASNTGVRQKTPLAQKTKKEFLLLEVHENEIFDADLAQENAARLKHKQAAELKRCTTGINRETVNPLQVQSTLNCIEAVEEAPFYDFAGSYEISLVKGSLFARRSGRATMTARDLETPGNWLESRLAKLNPKQDALFILLDNRSFSTYRKIRAIAQNRGFEIGWEPWSGDRIYFSSDGRTMSVQ
jgi:hypothetical protein